MTTATAQFPIAFRRLYNVEIGNSVHCPFANKAVIENRQLVKQSFEGYPSHQRVQERITEVYGSEWTVTCHWMAETLEDAIAPIDF